MKRRFLVFSIVLLLSTSLFAFSSLAATSDELLGEWLLNDGRCPCYYQSFTIRGEFEFPEVQSYLDDNRISNVEIIGVSIDDEGQIDDDTYYSTGYFWVSDNDTYSEGGYVELCYFTVYYSINIDPEPYFSSSIVHEFSWTFEPISYFNVISLDDSASPIYSTSFYEFINYNFHRYVEPPAPPEPTNIYSSCYNLINTWIFGDEIVPGSFHDLVCIQLSTISVLLFFSIPFIVVFWLIRRVC